MAQRVNHLMFINGRMTQRRLAGLIGVAAPTVAVKMTGRNRWSLDDLVSLCEVFGVSPNYMLGLEPIESAAPQKSIAPAARATGAMTLVAGAVSSFRT
ncbi:helix-turn-helix domain-containing protein [Microcella sp.]|uniref:helix-turn-helix domain-containing protein n=1 Tax=Microcella sp. TaxID=1913979 RepID=UPI003F6F90A5